MSALAFVVILGSVAMIALPLALIFLLNPSMGEQPVSLEQQYPDEHLGV